MKTAWRLIDTGPIDGPGNMAVDEALLENFDHENDRPVLRLYGWEPPAFSLGRFQPAGEALLTDRCAAAGIAVVRRITGGGVIFHAGELTYSIVCAQQHLPEAKGVKESFRALCSFLLATYRQLGLDAAFAADLADGGRLGARTPLCFAGRESFDVLIDGRKLGGNAQRRRRDIIFQHGSIPLRGMLPHALPFLAEVPPGFLEGATSLAELGLELPQAELKKVLCARFCAELGAELIEGRLTVAEEEMALRLARTKYVADRWNLEGENPCP